jgi:hypothetical protein
MARSPLVMPRGQRFSAPGAAMRARTAALLVAASIGLGVGSAWSLMGETPPLGAVRVGPWLTYPALGSSEVDPYSRAILARGPHLPLSTGEGLSFRATGDSGGSALTGRCRYRLAGQTLPSRGWSLFVTDAEGYALGGARAASLTDADLVTGEDGRIAVNLSPRAADGAWLQLPAGERFGLVLTFYDTPLSASAAQLSAGALPAITRVDCGA